MGQYNEYILAAYAIGGVVLLGIILHARSYQNKLQQRLKQWYRLFSE